MSTLLCIPILSGTLWEGLPEGSLEEWAQGGVQGDPGRLCAGHRPDLGESWQA